MNRIASQRGISLVTLIAAVAILIVVICIVVGTLHRPASSAVPAAVNSASGGSASKTASAAQKSPRPPFKTLVVEMAFEEKSYQDGQEYMRKTGKEFKYLDIAGNRRREDVEETVTTSGSESTVAGAFIFDGKTAYSFVKGNAKGDMTSVGAEDWIAWKDGWLDYLDEGLRKEMERKHVSRRGDPPGLVVGEASFLGRSCKLIRTSSEKEWTWYGILLKSESDSDEPPSTGSHSVYKAVSIRENFDIDEWRFHPPADVAFEPLKQTVAQSLDAHPSSPWSAPHFVRLFPLEMNVGGRGHR